MVASEQNQGTRWVTFDCFGTLVDWHTGFSALVAPFGGTRATALLKAYHEFERTVEAERPYRLYKEVLVTSLMRAARKVGVKLTETQARALPESWGTLPVFADVEEMLAGLRGMGFSLAVLTNCDDDLFEQTQRSFRQPFDLVITAERSRDYKPSQAHFRVFSTTTGADRSNWVHVACSWYHDIVPARDFGIRSIWLDRDATGEDPAAAAAHVRSAAEVCPAVSRLCGKPATPAASPQSSARRSRSTGRQPSAP